MLSLRVGASYSAACLPHSAYIFTIIQLAFILNCIWETALMCNHLLLMLFYSSGFSSIRYFSHFITKLMFVLNWLVRRKLVIERKSDIYSVYFERIKTSGHECHLINMLETSLCRRFIANATYNVIGFLHEMILVSDWIPRYQFAFVFTEYLTFSPFQISCWWHFPLAACLGFPQFSFSLQPLFITYLPSTLCNVCLFTAIHEAFFWGNC